MLAVPAPVAGRLVLGPRRARRLRADRQRAFPGGGRPAGVAAFLGIIGGTAEWVFRRHGIFSVTVSAADALVEHAGRGAGAQCCGRMSPRAYEVPGLDLPPCRHHQGAAGDVSRDAGAVAAAGRRRGRVGPIFSWRVIMSIPACPPRSKALFGSGLDSGRGWSPDGENAEPLMAAGETLHSRTSRSGGRRRICCAGSGADGAWCFELEADATISAEYILLNHFLDAH